MSEKNPETKLKLIRTLGKGVFGVVFEMKKTKDQSAIAVKKSFRISNKLSKEFLILQSLWDSSNIIQLKGVYFSQTQQGKQV